MFALGIEFLMGRAMMSRWQNREEAEWPPHPDRVFMALVAAWGESGEDERGGAALRFLESLAPPSIRVGTTKTDYSVRTPFISYVPVNDDCSPIKKKKAQTPMGALQIGRSRQPRSFPAVALADPTFQLVWPDAELGEHRTALESLCQQVTYVGHSASPVRMWITDSPAPGAQLKPVQSSAEFRLRGFGPGRTNYLKSRFDAQLRPQPAVWVGYASADDGGRAVVPQGPYESALVVLRVVEGRRLSLESCSLAADALRRTLMSRHGGTPPEWLSGHEPDGTPSRRMRPIVLPLGFVGHKHADGHLLGLGIAIPSEEHAPGSFLPGDFQLLQSLLRRHDEDPEYVAPGTGFVRLHWGKGYETCLEQDDRAFSERAVALKPDVWTKPSDCWTTVTPIVLPRFPRRNLTAAQIIATACVVAGYPEPAAVRVQYAPMLEGVPHARSFPTAARKPGMPPRLRMHARIYFPRLVRGPVAIGAGRYLGLGVCRPTPVTAGMGSVDATQATEGD